MREPSRIRAAEVLHTCDPFAQFLVLWIVKAEFDQLLRNQNIKVGPCTVYCRILRVDVRADPLQ